MRRIYGVRDESHRSMINRFLESAGTKLPTDLRVVCLYHRRRRSGYTEFDGWEIYRTGSKSCICRVSFHDNEVSWLKRGKIQKLVYLSDYIGTYTEQELLIAPNEEEYKEKKNGYRDDRISGLYGLMLRADDHRRTVVRMEV